MQFDIWLTLGSVKLSSHGQRRAGSVKAYRKRPACDESEIAVRLKIEVPDGVFEQPVYEAKFEIPKQTCAGTIATAQEVERIAGNLAGELSKQTGFRVKIEMPQASA